MSDSQRQDGNNKPPYQPPFGDESLLINSRLSEIERRQREEAEERRKHERSQRRSNWTMAGFTGLLFITSIISDIFLIRQASIGRESADAAKESADASLSSAMATVQQTRVAGEANWLSRANSISSERQSKAALDASIDASRNDQRAWIGIGGFMKPTLEVGKPFVVRYAVKNTVALLLTSQ